MRMANDTAAFAARAKARGLCLPKDVAPDRTVVWDGRAMHLVGDGEAITRSKFTYKSGEKMVGFVEQPCTDSSKLIAGEYRSINCANITKEGQDWKPGNRYNCTVRARGSLVLLDLVVLLKQPMCIPCDTVCLIQSLLCPVPQHSPW